MQHLACKSSVNSILFPGIPIAKTVKIGKIAQAKRCLMSPAGKIPVVTCPIISLSTSQHSSTPTACQSPPCFGSLISMCCHRSQFFHIVF